MASKLLTKFGLPLVGLACALLLWSMGVTALEKSTPIATAFAPLPTALAFREMLGGSDIWLHVVLSLQRVAVGLGLAIIIGVLLIGDGSVFHRFAQRGDRPPRT